MILSDPCKFVTMSQVTSRPRRLLLCLDGVPHKLIEQATQSWLVRQFWTTGASAFSVSDDDERRAVGDARSDAACGLRESLLRSQST